MTRCSRVRALAAALAALATTCRGAAPADRDVPPRAASAPRGRWTGDVPEGPLLRVEAGRYLGGSVRRTDTARAAPPYPARPFVAAARVEGGWRFATADGAVLDARDFLGPLTAVGRFDGSARPLSDGLEDGRLHAFSHRGALAWLDAGERAWAFDSHGARRLPLERVLDALFVSERRVFAITAPGVLHRSDDGGARFAAVSLDDGEFALSLGLAGDDALVATSRRRLRLDPATGSLVDARDLPSPVDAARALPPPLDAPASRLLPDDAARAAALSAATLVVADATALRFVDVVGGAVTRTVALPGQACAVAAGNGAPRAVCTHEGWARAAYALRDGARWELLRDELRAEPMGAVVFDDRSEAWVVAAPCRQQPQADATALCVYLPDGRPRTVHAPFDAQLVDMHDGAALVTATTGEASLTRAVLVRGEAMTALSLPVSPAEARAMRWHGDALSAWSRDARGGLVLHRAEVRGGRVAPWQRVEAPAGALRGLVSRDLVIAYGRDASALWSLSPDGRFVPLPSLVRGDARALALDLDAPSWCAGRVCRVAGALEFAADATGAPWFFAPSGSAATPPLPWRATVAARDGRGFYNCSVGPAEGPGPELDHGAAVSGYALHWERAGASLLARWEGATVRGALRAPWPAGVDGAALTAAAPVSATAPIALFSWCSGATCARRLGTPRGLFEVSLPAPARAHRSDLVMAEGGRVMALARGVTEGRTVAYAALLDPASGAVVATRAFACDGPPERVLPGSLGGVDGLWLPVDARRWRFAALRGEVPETVVEDPGAARACPATATTRGVLRRIDGYSSLRGEAWDPIADEWQIEERLELDGDGLCARSVGGGESRDESAFTRRGPERDLVRSFALTSDGDGRLSGSAWRGRQRFGMRCERVDRARAAAHAASLGLQFP